MNEPQLNMEGVHMLWALAFMIDIINGMMLIISVQRGIGRPGFSGVLWWMGWWFWADAMTLIVNEVLGPMNPFSFHQIGIVTGIGIFGGMTAYLAIFLFKNWSMTQEDWLAVEDTIRKSHLRRRMVESGYDPEILKREKPEPQEESHE